MFGIIIIGLIVSGVIVGIVAIRMIYRMLFGKRKGRF